ncbi:MAG: hypothetical protein HGB00_07110 [Chlorobiaceae bacterium]|nr:hypothetical protein [Chlorobiaceae bacterium]
MRIGPVFDRFGNIAHDKYIEALILQIKGASSAGLSFHYTLTIPVAVHTALFRTCSRQCQGDLPLWIS